MRITITLGFLLICFSAIGQIKPYQIESDTIHRMILVSDTVMEGGTEYPELKYKSLDTLVHEIVLDSLGVDSMEYWESDGANGLMQISDNSNLFLGNGAGSTTTTGIWNFIGGDFSFGSLTTGSYNFANGYQNYEDNSTGNGNFGSGYRNFRKLTGGTGNFGSGYQNFEETTTGLYNFGNGVRNYADLISGNYNFGNGYHNHYVQTGGSVNFSSGANNMEAALSGDYNFTHGFANMRAATSSNYSTGIGRENFRFSSSISYSFAAGYRNIYQSTSANNYAIVIGRENGYNNVSHSNSIYLGYRQGYTTGAANKLLIGMAQDDPLIDGSFSADSLRVNGTLSVRDKTGTATNVASWDGDKIIDSGTSIASLANTDAQTLSFTSPNLSISGGNSVDLSALGSDFDAMDFYSAGSTYFYRAEDAVGAGLGDAISFTAGDDIRFDVVGNNIEVNSEATSLWSDVSGELFSNTGGGAKDIIVGEIDFVFDAGTANQIAGRVSSTGEMAEVSVGSGLSLSGGTLSATSSSPWTDWGTYVATTNNENIYVANGEALLVGSTVESAYAVDIASTVEMRLLGDLYDKNSSNGADGDYLMSDGDQVEWVSRPFTLFSAANTSVPSDGELNVSETIASTYSASGTNMTVPSNGYYEIIVNFNYTTGGSAGDDFSVALRDGTTQLEFADCPAGPAFLNGGTGSILAVENLTTSSSLSIYVSGVSGLGININNLRVSFKKIGD